MSEVLVEVERVSKRFCRNLKQSLWYGVKDIGAGLCGLTTGGSDLRPGEFWALHDVSLELRRGECLGLIGANGAGKSTLLKMLNGLIKPDAGRIRIRGRISALIELGAGFHPLLSGRENIYVNASILGMSRRQTDRRLEEIIAFADIGDAIDAPVKSYSSGMRVRLGFAVAAHLEPDVLLIDEVLAVGDLAFRARCYERIRLLRDRSAMILVSHAAQTVLSICQLGLHLDHGRNRAMGTVDDAYLSYEAALAPVSEPTRVSANQPRPAFASSGLRIEGIFFRNREGLREERIMTGHSVTMCLACSALRSFEGINLSIAIRDVSGGTGVNIVLSGSLDRVWLTVPTGSVELHMHLPVLGLPPGTYTAKIVVAQDGISILDCIETYVFHVQSERPMANSTYFQPREWDCRVLSVPDTKVSTRQ